MFDFNLYAFIEIYYSIVAAIIRVLSFLPPPFAVLITFLIVCAIIRAIL